MEAELKKFFAGKSEVQVAYLFGSRATGHAHEGSDTDVAVLLDETFAQRYSLDYKLGLLADLKAALKRSDIDLVVLNGAPPLLKSQVTRHGKSVFSKDPVLPFRYKARAMVEYLDAKFLLDFFTRDAVRKIRGA